MKPILSRSSDGVLAGVLEGIANYFGWSASRLRVVYVVLSVLTVGFPGTLLYLCLWFVMPNAPDVRAGAFDARDV